MYHRNDKLLTVRKILFNFKDHWDPGLFTCSLFLSKCCVFRSALGCSTYMECCILRSTFGCSIYTEISYHNTCNANSALFVNVKTAKNDNQTCKTDWEHVVSTRIAVQDITNHLDYSRSWIFPEQSWFQLASSLYTLTLFCTHWMSRRSDTCLRRWILKAARLILGHRHSQY